MVRRLALFFIGLGFVLAADVGLILALSFAQVPIKAIVVGVAVFTVIGVAALVCLFQLQVMVERPDPQAQRPALRQSRQSHQRSGPIIIPSQPAVKTDLLVRSANKTDLPSRHLDDQRSSRWVERTVAENTPSAGRQGLDRRQTPLAPTVKAVLESSERPKIVAVDSGYSKPVIRDIREKHAINVVAPANLERLSIADLMEEVHRQGHSIATLIRDSQERIVELEVQTINRMHLTDALFADSLMNAQRIVLALESRLERLKSLAKNPSSPEFFQAKSVLQEELHIPRDAVNALINSKDLPKLPPSEWGPVLDRLLSTAEASVKRLFGPNSASA